MHPSLVVAHSQIIGRGQELERVPVGVEVPLAPGSHRTGERVDPRLPGCVEHRLVLLVLDGAHVLLTAHVVRAVHGLPPDGGNVTFATPTIASRVTSAANCSSVIVSVPVGRSGRTR